MASEVGWARRQARTLRRSWVVPLAAWGIGAVLTLTWARAPASSEARPEPPASSARPKKGSPLVGAEAPSDQARDFEGIARERLDVGSYLYFEIEADDGARRWVATLATSEARIGERVRVSTYATREGFESKRLARRFERLWFGRVSPLEGRAGNPG
jgi:hypothetical protein